MNRWFPHRRVGRRGGAGAGALRVRRQRFRQRFRRPESCRRRSAPRRRQPRLPDALRAVGAGRDAARSRRVARRCAARPPGCRPAVARPAHLRDHLRGRPRAQRLGRLRDRRGGAARRCVLHHVLRPDRLHDDRDPHPGPRDGHRDRRVRRRGRCDHAHRVRHGRRDVRRGLAGRLVPCERARPQALPEPRRRPPARRRTSASTRP